LLPFPFFIFSNLIISLGRPWPVLPCCHVTCSGSRRPLTEKRTVAHRMADSPMGIWAFSMAAAPLRPLQNINNNKRRAKEGQEYCSSGGSMSVCLSSDPDEQNLLCVGCAPPPYLPSLLLLSFVLGPLHPVYLVGHHLTQTQRNSRPCWRAFRPHPGGNATAKKY
jgi:hypothetical protein